MPQVIASLQGSRNLLNTAAFLYCGGLLGFAMYLQFHEGLEPCPLCILQRIAFLVTGLLFLAAAIQAPGRIGSRVYAVLVGIAGATGAAIAARHVWIQHLPSDQVPECGPGLDYILEVFPLMDGLKMVFTGSGECSEISWVFLGLTMPTWSLLNFLALIVAGLVLNWTATEHAGHG